MERIVNGICYVSENEAVLDIEALQDIYTEELWEEILDCAMMEFCFDVHKAMKLNYLFLDPDLDPEFNIPNNTTATDCKEEAENDVENPKKDYDIICPNCSGSFNAVGYGKHLPVCIWPQLNKRNIRDADEKEIDDTAENQSEDVSSISYLQINGRKKEAENDVRYSKKDYDIIYRNCRCSFIAVQYGKHLPGCIWPQLNRRTTGDANNKEIDDIEENESEEVSSICTGQTEGRKKEAENDVQYSKKDYDIIWPNCRCSFNAVQYGKHLPGCIWPQLNRRTTGDANNKEIDDIEENESEEVSSICSGQIKGRNENSPKPSSEVSDDFESMTNEEIEEFYEEEYDDEIETDKNCMDSDDGETSTYLSKMSDASDDEYNSDSEIIDDSGLSDS